MTKSETEAIPPLTVLQLVLTIKFVNEYRLRCSNSGWYKVTVLMTNPYDDLDPTIEVFREGSKLNDVVSKCADAVGAISEMILELADNKKRIDSLHDDIRKLSR